MSVYDVIVLYFVSIGVGMLSGFLWRIFISSVSKR